jgi:hypothetical protein
MNFSEYCEMRDAGKLKTGLLAGVVAAGLLSPLAVNSPNLTGAEVKNTDKTRAMLERTKDKGAYYDPGTERKLRAMAERGDLWALRELPWPPSHVFHREGRPFFRNNGPHPDGLKFYSGFVGDDGRTK